MCQQAGSSQGGLAGDLLFPGLVVGALQASEGWVCRSSTSPSEVWRPEKCQVTGVFEEWSRNSRGNFIFTIFPRVW